MIKTNLMIGSRYPVDRDQLKQKVTEVLQAHQLNNAQVDVSIVGKRKIKQLNEQQLNHQGVTDVLSFPQHQKKNQINHFPVPKGEPPHLGDIVICYPVAVQAAKRYGKMVDDQLCFYIEHGLMHLLGYHHD
ncbi:MAG: rRNA maturation RNase YbeY [Candidatus Pacebacteria bacterium]|nr:rRNA maturation RNase YbeY [Candidatus Paceibacterota bacterium]